MIIVQSEYIIIFKLLSFSGLSEQRLSPLRMSRPCRRRRSSPLKTNLQIAHRTLERDSGRNVIGKLYENDLLY